MLVAHLARQANFINLKKHKTLIDQTRQAGNFAAWQIAVPTRSVILKRGVHFRDTDGHYLEVITRPYGSGGWEW
jgi:hypothetical protein